MVNWKDVELRIASMLGGKRVPITGRQRGDVPDVQHEWLSIEVKTRRVLPGWMRLGMVQAEAAQKPGQLPIFVMHQHGDRYDDAMVCMRLKDWLDWFGNAPVAPQAGQETLHEQFMREMTQVVVEDQ